MMIQKRINKNMISKLFFVIFLFGQINYIHAFNPRQINQQSDQQSDQQINLKEANIIYKNPITESWWFDYTVEYDLSKYNSEIYELPMEEVLNKNTYKTLIKQIKNDIIKFDNEDFTSDIYLKFYKLNMGINKLIDIFYYHVNDYNLKDFDFTKNSTDVLKSLLEMLDVKILTNKNKIIKKTDEQNKEFNRFKIYINQILVTHQYYHSFSHNKYPMNF